MVQSYSITGEVYKVKSFKNTGLFYQVAFL